MKPIEAEDIRVGDTIRIEYRSEDMRGKIALERIIKSEKFRDILKDEIQDGLYKAVYLLDREPVPLPTEPGLYYRNTQNNDAPTYQESVYELGFAGDWWDPQGDRLTEDDLQFLRKDKYPLERLVFER